MAIVIQYKQVKDTVKWGGWKTRSLPLAKRLYSLPLLHAVVPLGLQTPDEVQQVNERANDPEREC